MTNIGFPSQHFAMAEKVGQDGKLATSALLVKLAVELDKITGLTDEDILHVVIGQSQGWKGEQEMEAVVYYSLDSSSK